MYDYQGKSYLGIWVSNFVTLVQNNILPVQPASIT